jgi:hypothetical protein
MSLKVSISNVCNWLRGLFSSPSPVEMEEESVQPSGQPVRKSNAGRKALKLNVAAMASMRSAGKTDAEIGRKFRCSSHTVASRLRDYTPPIPPPALPLPAQHAQSQPAPPVVTLKPPIVPATVPQPPVLIPQVIAPPIDNADDLLRRRPWLAAESSWRNCFFLVNAVNPLNLELCTNNAQHGVAVERWHDSYRALEVFQSATKIWVVLDASDDNAEFLHSLVEDIWIRERCVIVVGNILEIAKFKTDGKVGTRMSVESFEVACRFKPMPQPNHVELIRQLLEKPTPPATESQEHFFGGSGASWGIGGTGYQAPSGLRIEVPSSGSKPDGSGFCF